MTCRSLRPSVARTEEVPEGGTHEVPRPDLRRRARLGGAVRTGTHADVRALPRVLGGPRRQGRRRRGDGPYAHCHDGSRAGRGDTRDRRAVRRARRAARRVLRLRLRQHGRGRRAGNTHSGRFYGSSRGLARLRRGGDVMKYLMLLNNSVEDARSWESLSEEGASELRSREVPRWEELFAWMGQTGIELDGLELDGPSKVKTVRVRSEEALVTDGPYVETKEQIGGDFLVELDKLHQAIELATRIPVVE